MSNPRITFVIDLTADGPSVDALDEDGFDVVIQRMSVGVYEELVASPPDLLILDVSDPSEGVALLKRVRASSSLKRIAVLVIAEWGTGQSTLALSNGADAIERKPIDAPRLSAAVTRLLQPHMVLTARAGTNGDED